MNTSKADEALRLERLKATFARRRVRLAADLVRKPTRVAGSTPLVTLQHHGYSAALALVVTAFLPTVIRFAFRRRKLLFSALATGMRVRKWRTRLEAPPPGRRR